MLAAPELKKTKPVSFAQSAKFAEEVARLSPGNTAETKAAVNTERAESEACSDRSARRGAAGGSACLCCAARNTARGRSRRGHAWTLMNMRICAV